MADSLQAAGLKALTNAPKPLQRALTGLGIRFVGDNGQASPMAGGLGPNNMGMMAGVEKGSPNTVSVLKPNVFKGPAADQLATHEGLHVLTNNLPPSLQARIPADNPNDPYNYGGTQRIAKLVNSGGTILDLPKEQGAAAMQYYQSQGGDKNPALQNTYGKLAKTIEQLPLSQIQMTDPNQQGINTTPRAPRVPASSVPGMNFASNLYMPGQPAPGDGIPSALLPPPPNVSLASPFASDTAMPDLPASTPNVQGPSPLERNIASDQQQLQKVRWAQANPWGTENNHPGKIGKIAHVLSVAGNIAGNIVAPNVMALTPGTMLNRQVQERGLTGRLNEEQQQESEDNSRDAQTSRVKQEIADDPAKQASDQALQGAQTAHLNAETEAAKNPAPQYEFQQTDHGLLRIDKKTGAAQPVTLNGQPLGPKTQTKVANLEIGGQEHSVLIDEATGQTIKDLGSTGQKPPVVNVNAGTWTPMEGPDGKPELFNSKTGQTREAPAGMQKPGTAAKNQQLGLKTYGPSMDSAERFNIMAENAEKALRDHDQQAMLSLLTNHLGMTAGVQKGMRINQAMIDEAAKSQPWLASMKAKFDKDGYLSGVNLSPKQIHQMVQLGSSRFAEDTGKARSEAKYAGLQGDGPDRIPSQATIRYYTAQANGDPNKAKQLAAQDGWSIK